MSHDERVEPSGIMPHTAERSIATYIRAKDWNRPYLMAQAFAERCTLEIVAKPGTMTFPTLSEGIDQVTDVLVRRFAQTYENVHTFCLAAPPQTNDTTFACPWLVGMSEKETGKARVGCGHYEWVFRSRFPRLAERLVISIDLMETLPAETVPAIMVWLSRLPWPWSSPQAALEAAPKLDGLRSIIRYVGAA